MDTVPEYQLGEVEGEEPYLFSRIWGARRLSDGRVVALEGLTCELRFFGEDGVFLDRKGGKGEGPGEFRRCGWVPSSGNDSLLIYDSPRLHFFDDRGLFDRSLPVSWRGTSGSVIGVAGKRVLLRQSVFYASQKEGLHPKPTPWDYGLVELGGQDVAWEGFFQGTQHFTVLVPGGPHAIWTIPFDILPDAAVGGDGFFLTLGEVQGPEILEYDTAGQLRRIIRLAEPVVRPSPETLDRFINTRVERDLRDSDLLGTPDAADRRAEWRDSYERRFKDMPLPEFIPVFSRLLVDDVGWLWAELYRYEVGTPERWLVFGPNGEGHGSVDMPPGLRVWQIGRDFVLGVWRGERDVEYVRRHPLTGRR